MITFCLLLMCLIISTEISPFFALKVQAVVSVIRVVVVMRTEKLDPPTHESVTLRSPPSHMNVPVCWMYSGSFMSLFILSSGVKMI